MKRVPPRQPVLASGLLRGGLALQVAQDQSGPGPGRPALDLIGNLFGHPTTPRPVRISRIEGGLPRAGGTIRGPNRPASVDRFLVHCASGGQPR